MERERFEGGGWGMKGRRAMDAGWEEGRAKSSGGSRVRRSRP